MNIAIKLHHAFDLFAERTAISEDKKNITYHSLYRHSLKIAAFLACQKIKNTCIAIEVDNTMDHIMAILGVVFSGNYYVSITKENKPFFLAANALPVALTICCDSKGTSGREVSIGYLLELEDIEISKAIKLSIDPLDKMCAFFTSGSTGRSKIIVHNHQNILKDTTRQIAENEITPQDKLDFVFSLSFSASLACIYPALLTGAELCIFDLKEKGLQKLADFWQHKSITFSTLAVSSFQGICKISSSFHHLAALRFISISAEPVKDTTINFFKSKFPAHTVLQIAYASTETRTIAEIKVYNDGRPQCYLESVGKPVAGKQVIIAGDDGKPLPEEAVGEVIVQSEYIAEAYWGEAGESSSSFSRQGNIIRYRTGDLAYLNANGYLFYCGRYENENKINGIKINLSQVEEEMEKIEGILQAAAIINSHQFNQPKLVCFFQTTGIFEVPESAIRKKIAAHLPSTHLPHLYIKTEQLPHTHSGKIDRKQLQQMIINNSVKNDEPISIILSADKYEKSLIAIFKKVLETDNIHADSDFFDSGGDSLTSLLCAVEIENHLKLSFPTFELINHPTPAKLSRFLISHRDQPAVLVKAVPLNVYSKEKRNLYFLNHALNNQYQYFADGPLSSNFNLIELFYELHHSYKIENGANLIISQLAKIISEDKEAVVAGHSFNGYMAYQLACMMPQISYCILIDTYNYFEFEKYKAKYHLKEKLGALLWQVIKNKDYNFPFYWAKRFYTWHKPNKPVYTYETGFLEGVDYLLSHLNNKPAINNCIYFQSSRTYMFTKDPGLSWESYVSGDFHFLNFNANHHDIIKKNNLKMSSHINKLIVKKG